MKKLYALLTLVVVLMVAPLVANAATWSMLGANPNQLTRSQSVEKLSFPIDVERVKYTVWYTPPDTVQLEEGMIFRQMIFGRGQVLDGVIYEYPGLAYALRWSVDGILIYEVQRCGNVGWAYSPQVVIGKDLAPQKPDTAMVIPPVTASQSSGIPGWFQTLFWIVLAVLLIAFGIWALYHLLRNLGQGNPPAAPPAPPAPSAPKPEPDRLTKLREMTAQLAELDTQRAMLAKSIAELTVEIKNDLAVVEAQLHPKKARQPKPAVQ